MRSVDLSGPDVFTCVLTLLASGFVTAAMYSGGQLSEFDRIVGSIDPAFVALIEPVFQLALGSSVPLFVVPHVLAIGVFQLAVLGRFRPSR